ncbi:YbhB/YbcL family Raf kinase inhibitor-like protein [Bacillus sp. sid0103]|uniref:YbhB/YbcL family Raf kinase inhibitor-like protein n=1 Tax=Bacillus sp. sid0103 TaxID=2856337 RepID=UPI001C451CBC|nr:YbhB/YbcL family Raf kinase inhibitor-like protein [Bacillus sp. sid0103]MBV7506488.1 YbhB/YbcL family Raf kinase inhibitor-like protein [Bacillus sp. sid0103]
MSKEVIGNAAGDDLKRNTPVSLIVNGKTIGTKAININTKLLVPLKEVFESSGAFVNINETNTLATVRTNDFSFEVMVGETQVIINDQDSRTIPLDHEVIYENNEIFVSVRFALTVLKAKLGREAEAGIVTIETLPDNGLKVTSLAFEAWGNIPHKFVQHSVGGENISMPIKWTGAPANAKSFAVVIYDAHVLSEYWVHWAVINIDDATSELAENAAVNLTDYRQIKPYYGMQPAELTGDHAYQIAVYALDIETIEIPHQVVFFEDIAPILESHMIASGTLVSFFQS